MSDSSRAEIVGARPGAAKDGATAREEPRVVFGVLAALPEELGSLGAAGVGDQQGDTLRELEPVAGLRVRERAVGRARLLLVVGGVGKAQAAHGAAALLAAGARSGRPVDGLLVVGVCGGLTRGLAPGARVCARRTLQTDLALRDAREARADESLSRAWGAAAQAEAATFLTADRPVLSLWRRLRLARAFLGPCVADMETAAAARVAERAGVPWAALRTVTDRADGAAARSFRRHFPSLAGVSADTIPALLDALGHR